MLPPAPVYVDSTESEITTVLQQSPSQPVAFGKSTLSAAFRFIEPTWRNYITYVDMESRTGNEDARRFLKTWQSLPPRERMSSVPEQLCELATVTAADLIAWVSRQVWVEGSAKTSMVLSFNRDRVLERTAEFAMASPDNARHAEMFLKAAGAMPTAGRGGGSSISIYNAPVASSGSVALANSKSESSPVFASGFRDMDAEIVELSRVMQGEGDAVPVARAELIEDDEDDEDEEDDDEPDD